MYSIRVYIRILGYLAAILAAAGGGVWLVFSGRAVILGIAGVAGALGLTAGLVGYLNRSNRRIQRFLEALQDEEVMAFFPEKEGSGEEKGLYAAFNRVNEQLARLKRESGRLTHFYEVLIGQIPAGIVSWDGTGRVRVANEAALRLLGCVSLRTARQLEQAIPAFAGRMKELSTTGSALLKIPAATSTRSLAAAYRRIVQEGEVIHILTLKDIGRELSEKESQSWDKLTHVLTHEIMNSIAPVVSLSATLLSYYQPGGVPCGAAEVTDRMVAKTIRGLQTVRSQGQSLMRFTESYRRLSYVQPPVIRLFSLNRMVESLQVLLQADLERHAIGFTLLFTPKVFSVEGDEELLSQVLLNLLKNAIEALEEVASGRTICLKAVRSAEEIRIEVTDNGPGVAKELLEDVFVPFFTTKAAGSGIGLSLSRQIVRMHGGELIVSSEPFVRTRFTMVLPVIHT